MGQPIDVVGRKLGFEDLRQLLSELTLSPMGKERVAEIAFSKDILLIREQLRQTAEMKRLLSEEAFPVDALPDARAALHKLRMEGAHAEPKELRDLSRALKATSLIITAIKHPAGEHTQPFTALSELCEGVNSMPQLTHNIDRLISDEGEVRDNASPTLARLRRQIQAERGRMSQLIQRVLVRAKAEGLVDAEASPALREGRLVLPVPADRKRKLPGIVHDMSDTGRTAYVEPVEVVEASASLMELENEERREVLIILRALSATIRPYIPEALRCYDFLAHIDLLLAKARLAQRIDGHEPADIANHPLIQWQQATHPLLRMALEGTGKPLVPLDISLHHPEQRILLISGPNAGGKSVCLKTVGLLQYMLQCGLLPPLSPDSHCGIFDNIFINIGDEQDLADDLSTYSAHLLHMKDMLRRADERSLLLIDEFGSGTEPQMGAALAEAMLAQFLQHGNFAIITTHYHNLKVFAADNEGIANAAMLYDRQEMRPLFLLQIGNPGSSFAIEIAHKIGLPDEVIARAKDIAGSDLVNFDKFLQDINRDKRYWESKRAEIHQQEKALQRAKEEYEQASQQLSSQRKDIIRQAKAEAQQLVDESQARIERTIKEIKEAQAERERTKEVRAELETWLSQRQQSEEEDQRIKAQAEKVKRRQQRRKEKKAAPAPAATAKPTRQLPTTPVFAVGDYVKLAGQSTAGRIVKLNGKEAQVVFGAMQVNARLSQLQPAAPPKDDKRDYTLLGRQTQDQLHKTKLKFSPEINLMGMRADEALQAITYFIDDALVAEAHRLRILHGTGTGALKTTVRRYLNSEPAVVRYYDENPQFGGAGITIVEL